MKRYTETGISNAAAQQIEALSLDDTATQLAAEAASPAVDIPATATKGRKLALQAMEHLGPFHQDAAARALSGTDQDVLDYLRTRWKDANHSDIRQRVVDLSVQSPYASVRTAATNALAGTPQQIEAFSDAGQYEAGRDDMRVDVARLAQTGGISVSQKAKDVLADGTGKALATFLQIGQHAERLTDERVVTARLAETGGPELSAAARVALAGPPNLVREFIAQGQYMAQRKDDLAKVHIHQVGRLLAEGAKIAAQSQADASRAAQAAALAREAADEAKAAAAEAENSSRLAEGYAADAKESAEEAGRSAAVPQPQPHQQPPHATQLNAPTQMPTQPKAPLARLNSLPITPGTPQRKPTARPYRHTLRPPPQERTPLRQSRPPRTLGSPS
ncbi:ALF repeat-containing protein [Streptomyces arboris]|uniref:ALF repeat-containing protein n=1 Tax=Streptomyces arboris TaxID=2600619 RepID=UPI003BF4EC1E